MIKYTTVFILPFLVGCCFLRSVSTYSFLSEVCRWSFSHHYPKCEYKHYFMASYLFISFMIALCIHFLSFFLKLCRLYVGNTPTLWRILSQIFTFLCKPIAHACKIRRCLFGLDLTSYLVYFLLTQNNISCHSPDWEY